MPLLGKFSDGLIVEIHLIVQAPPFVACLEQLTQVLKTEGPAEAVPLYYSHDLEDTEVRVCFLVRDLGALESFVVNKLRALPGVVATRLRLTLNGRLFPGGYQALLDPGRDVLSTHVFIKNDAAKDAAVWAALSDLTKQDGVYPTWIFRDYYEYDRDLTLRVMGPDLTQIRGYLDRNLSCIDGLHTWRFKIMKDFVKIQSDEFLLKLASAFVD